MVICVIVEPRQHPALKMVVQNMISHGPLDAPILIMHGLDNEKYVHTIFKGFKQIKFHNLKINNLSIANYSKLLFTKHFWTILGRMAPKKMNDLALIFQTDSFVIPGPRSRWDYWLNSKYAYVGAPWRRRMKHKLKRTVGNGGFSLRSISASRDILKQIDPNTNNPEDVVFSNAFLHSKTHSLPSPEQAMKFSCESTRPHPDRPPIGIHKLWRHMNPKQWSMVVSKWPILERLRKLQAI